MSEIRVTANLQHPNLLPLFDSGEADGLLFYVMPYVEGESLRATLDREKQLPVHTAVRIAVAVASALDHAHRHGVIHRDLKPENILLQEGQPLVADFGIALAVSNAGGSRITQTGLSLGTPQYMSPEQATGERGLDARTDVYSLGAVLYEMLTGEPPHTGATAQAIVARVLTERPRPVRATRPTVPPHVEAAVVRALEKLPADRFSSAGDFGGALEAGEAGYRPAVDLPASRGRLRATALAIGGAAAVIAATAFLAGRRTAASTSGGEWVGQVLGSTPVAMQPWASPDGKSVAFSAMVDGILQVGVTSVATGEWRIRTTDRTRGSATSANWSPDGTRIYFSRYFEVPRGVFSISAVDGEEQLVLEDAGSPQPLSDGSILVVRLGATRRFQLFRYHPDARRLDTLNALGSPRGDIDLPYRAFHDEREVAFFGRPANDSAAQDHLYALDLKTNRVRTLVPGISVVAGTWQFPLAVSADDRSVVFAMASGSMYNIVAAPRDGSNRLESLISLTGTPLNADVGADGALYVDQVDQPAAIGWYTPATHAIVSQPLLEVPGSGFVLPLPDGRVLASSRYSSRSSIALVAAGKNPTPFVNAPEEMTWPAALLGSDRVLLRTGHPSLWKFGVVELATGRIDAERTSALQAIDATDVTSLAGSRDGKTVFFAQRGGVWAQSIAGGAPRRLHDGEEVAPDPDGTSLVVVVTRNDSVHLVRVRIADGAESSIPWRDTVRLVGRLSPRAVGADGRIAVRVAASGSWFWPVGLLDPRTGRIEIVPPGFTADAVYGGWTDSGTVVTLHNTTQSRLWRFTRTSKPNG